MNSFSGSCRHKRSLYYPVISIITLAILQAMYLMQITVEAESNESFSLKLERQVPGNECDYRINMKFGQEPLVINSFNYPASYHPFTNCRWIIKVPFGNRIRVHFETFHLEYSLFCTSDYVEIMDLLGQHRFCGVKTPEDGLYTSIGPKIEIYFISDGKWEFKGFSMKVTVLKVYCGEIVYNTHYGTIVSPGYPNKYPNNVLCIWTFVNTEGVVNFSCKKPFEVESSPNCDLDMLMISETGDDQLLEVRKYCGKDNPINITSEKNKLHVLFYANLIYNYPGFLCEYQMNVTDETENEIKRTQQNEATCECGRDITPSFRIYKGNLRNHTYPLVALVYNDGEVFCGGTLISHRYIVTAAHCLTRETPNSFKVALEGYENPNTETKNLINVKRFYIHENFAKKDNDIALIKIPRRFGRLERSFVACLPPDNLNINIGEKGTALGWGENYIENDDRLYEVDVPIIDNSSCVENYNAFSERQFCAGVYDANVGRGDSGGPFFMTYNNRLTLIGLVSYGKKTNARNYPSVFTRVPVFVDWIAKHTDDTCTVKNAQQ